MGTRLFPTLFGAGIGLAVVASPALAADDIRAKAQLCAACHGQNGVPTDPNTIPIIWGQDRSYLFKQMRDYRNGERDNPIMSPIAQSLAEEDLSQDRVLFRSQNLAGTKRCLHIHPAAEGYYPVPAMPSAQFSGWTASPAPGGSQLRIPRHVDG